MKQNGAVYTSGKAIRKVRLWIRLEAMLIIFMMMSTGCVATKTNKEKIKDLEYTVVEDEDLPEELKTEIDGKKEAQFKLTYKNDEYLYISEGYGEQETGGYSIQVRKLYLTSNAIFFDTEIFGPQKGEKITQSPSYPYIVLKVELRAEPVVFA